MPTPFPLLLALTLAQPGPPQDDVPGGPGASAIAQAAARTLTDEQLRRFAVFLREVTGGGGGEEVAEAAAAKAGLSMRQVGGLSLLIAEYRAALPPRRDFERRHGAAATRLLAKHEPALLETQRLAIERAMGGLGPAGGAGSGGRGPSSTQPSSSMRPKGPAGGASGSHLDAWADCPAPYRSSASVDGGPIVYYCNRPCRMNVLAGGEQAELKCSHSTSTRGDQIHIEIWSTEGGLSAGFTVDTRTAGAAPTGQGFSAGAPSLTHPGAGQVFASGRIQDPYKGRDFRLSCEGKQPPRAEVVVDWAAPFGRVHFSDPPKTGLNWATHGTATATLYECGPDGQVLGTMEVEARF